MKSILNISAYKFVALSDTVQWRESIRSQAQANLLKGTVLLADEGINLSMAGAESRVRGFVAWLRGHEVFADLSVKESWSVAAPFGKLLVKVKPEIIRMNHPTIRPHARRAPAVDATTLARWLRAGVDDGGREVVTLDTRNAFEVDRGRFRGAHDWRMGKFSEFPAALRARRGQLEGKTVVSFCTGGIRCEKAALHMQHQGLPHVYQLEGGILKYFEIAGDAHFQGHCFVFDERVALGADLLPARKLPRSAAVVTLTRPA